MQCTKVPQPEIEYCSGTSLGKGTSVEVEVVLDVPKKLRLELHGPFERELRFEILQRGSDQFSILKLF
jgi:hypothetical protein